MKKYIGITLLFFSVISATEISFTVETPLAQLSLVPEDTFTMVSIGGFEYEQRFGAPMLPIISKKFCIPTNEAVVSYNIMAIDSIVVPGQYLVFPVQPPEPMSGGVFYPPDSTIYNSVSPFPEEIVNFSSPHYMAGVKTTDVRVNPVRYCPALRKLVLYTHLEIKLILGPSPSNACPVVKRSLKQHQDILNSTKIVVDNPEQVEVFTTSPPIVPDSLFASEQWPPGPWTFVIITTADMRDEFQMLADWRIDKGLRTRIVTKEWIEVNLQGRDIQEKIRKYIKDVYSRLGTQYVLIGGDEEIIPTRIAYAGLEDPDYNNVPSDLYYSDLEGWWDGDWEGTGADNIFCNFADLTLPKDSVDFDPDVSVGRISVSTETEAAEFINKLLIYEQTPSDEYSSLADFLLLGANMNGPTWTCSGGEIKDSCIADISPTISVFGLYDQEYHGWTPHDRIGRQPCLDYISDGFYLINHMGHGWITHIYVGYDGPYSEELIYRDVRDLTNVQKCSFMYSLSCASADFWSAQDCFGEYWLSAGTDADEKGLIAYLGHTKCGWFNASAPGTACSAILDRNFFRILTHCEHPRRGTNIIGLALSIAKLDLPNVEILDRYEHISLNALADPTTPAWICKPLVITASHPSEIAVNRWVDLTVAITDENGLPVAGAGVGLNKIDDIYEMETTNSAGQATFHIYANITGTINVTASKTMCIPSRTSIEVRGGFWSDDPFALAYNGNRHLVRKTNSEELHLVYTDWGQVIYLYSTNGGGDWTLPEIIGDGKFPAIALSSTYLPAVTWTDNLGALWFRMQIEPGQWSPVILLYYPWDPYDPRLNSPPSMAIMPSTVEDTVHILVSFSGRIAVNGVIHSVEDCSFPVTDPGQKIFKLIEQGVGLLEPPLRSFPSIVKGIQDTLHALWQRGDTICYATKAIEQEWNVWGWQFEDAGLQSAHPFVESYGDSVFVVWQRKEPPSMQEEVYRAARYLGEAFLNINWGNLSLTPDKPSLYPQNAGGSFTFFADIPDPPDEEFEIYYKIKAEDPAHNISQSPNIWSLYPHSSVMFTPGGANLYIAWLEGNALLPYEVRFKTIKPPGIEHAYLTSLNGYETPSPYLVHRDSFISEWEIPVDVGYETVTYQFPLVPNYRYKLKTIAYHESGGEWREWIKIDNKLKHQIKYNAYEPETLELWIPPAFYQDSVIEVVFDRKKGDFATAGPIYIYQYEYEEGEGGGPQASMIIPQSLTFGLKVLPNIVSRGARLRYTIPEKQRVTLNLYDIVGRKVVSIADDVVEPGIYTYNLNSSNLSQGIYFLILEGEKKTETKKVLVVK